MDPLGNARFPSEELLKGIVGRRKLVFSLAKHLESLTVNRSSKEVMDNYYGRVFYV